MLEGKRAARAMEGRKIVRAELTEWDGAYGESGKIACHNLVLHLDNGARVHFVVEESEIGEYGIAPLYYPRST